MKFLRKVLHTKVEETEDHNKKMFAKTKIIIYQCNNLLEDLIAEGEIKITED